ncbi:helix-turn-helix transcriptional regulator [Natronomonas salina]|uniref:winged helix-turn-helix domain-containing protein n=1 Tax=Natronomonas salina TaxID=1710540 RepID=UPI0015B52697|nr:helix-turn-helix domain-containing protein [Natronomonas salina]QLD88656.1 helix-turn-helix transcriptional regulator [Natronomonas salina]
MEMNPDDLFDVLADRERRRVLEQLVERNAASHVGLLKDRCDVNGTLLRHVHLPKMDKAGLVDYDPRTGDVALTDDGTDVKLFLEALDEMRTTGDLPTPTAF